MLTKYTVVFRRRVVTLFLALSILLGAVAFPVEVYAAGKDGSDIGEQIRTQMEDRQLYYFLKRCFLLQKVETHSLSTIKNWEYFKGGKVNDVMNEDKNGKNVVSWLDRTESVRGAMLDTNSVSCENGGWIQNAFSRFGLGGDSTAAYKTFCKLEFTRNTETGGRGAFVPGTAEDCEKGFKDGKGKGASASTSTHMNQGSALDELLDDAAPEKFAKVTSPLKPAVEYVRNYITLMKACGVKLTERYKAGAEKADSRFYRVEVVNADGKVESWLGKSSLFSRDSTVKLVSQVTPNTYPWRVISCGELAERLLPTKDGGKGLAEAYSAYLVAHTDEETAVLDDADPPSTTTEAATTSRCEIDGIGWIICPVMRFMAQLNDAAFSTISNILTVRPELLDPASSTRKAWGAFLSIANVAFIVAFLVIIYSQLTNVGVGNYGIKRLLPKLIIAALLVNVSYYVCQILVDLSNIVGASIYNLLGAGIEVGVHPVGVGGPNIFERTIDGILGMAAATGVLGLLVVAVLVMPAALLGFVVAVLILVARQALVILLVVVSPLAFVAYLLPNTESWFKKWWKAFTATLMVFPIVGVIFGASTLASTILMEVAGTGVEMEDGGNEDLQMLALVALGVQAIPLLALPMIMKSSLAVAGSFGGKVTGMFDKAWNKGASQANKRTVGKASERASEAYKNSAWKQGRAAKKQGKREYRQNQLAGALIGSPDNTYQKWRGRFYKGAGVSDANKYAERQIVGSATAARSKANNEMIEHEQREMSTTTAPELLNIMSDRSASIHKRAAAARQLVEAGGDQHIQAAYDYLDKQGASLARGDANADQSIGDLQQFAAQALLTRKPAGLGSTEAHALGQGLLGAGRDGGADRHAGFENRLAKRVNEGALGGSDYLSMGKDELIRLGEMVERGDIQGEGLDGLHAALVEAGQIATRSGKGISAERAALFRAITREESPRVQEVNGETPFQNGVIDLR